MPCQRPLGPARRAALMKPCTASDLPWRLLGSSMHLCTTQGSPHPLPPAHSAPHGWMLHEQAALLPGTACGHDQGLGASKQGEEGSAGVDVSRCHALGRLCAPPCAAGAGLGGAWGRGGASSSPQGGSGSSAPLGGPAAPAAASPRAGDERPWAGQRRLPAGDRATLLRLMCDEHYQQVKLGGRFSPARQGGSQLFVRLAAAYLERPLLQVAVEGMRLQPGAAGVLRGGSRDVASGPLFCCPCPARLPP